MCVFDYDPKLPKLPVPSLSDTAALLRSELEPITDSLEFERVNKLLDELESSGGARLQELLLKWRDSFGGNQSWLRPIWNDNYLSYRQHLPINMNYCFQLTGRWGVLALPLFITSLCSVINSARREDLPPEPSKNGFLSMDTLGHMIYTRIPSPVRDIQYFPRLSDPMTAAVVCRGHWFILALTDCDGKPHSAGAIGAALEKIRQEAGTAGDSPGVGAMSCAGRDEAFALRQALNASVLNRQSLDRLEKSLFAVCLDEDETGDEIYGGALVCGDPENRWFDKSLQVISSPQGRLGLSIEHSGCDAAIWVYLLSQADVRAGEACLAEGGAPAGYRKLDWHITEDMRQRLKRVADTFKNSSGKLTFDQRHISGVTKEAITSKKHSPDFFVQLLFQIAYYKCTGKFRSVYEAVSTRGFYQGRTECVRSCTSESAAFVKAFTGGSDDGGLKSLLDAAELVHKNRIQRGRSGLGAQRHMSGLNAMYQMYSDMPGYEDLSLPAIFSDPSYLDLCHDALSTSSVTAPFMEYFGFGPVVSDGVGLGYGVAASSTHIMVSAYKDSGVNAREFAQAIEEAVPGLLSLIN